MPLWIRSLFGKSAPVAEPPPAYFSRYGGLWIDRTDFAQQLAKRERSGRLTKEQAAQVRAFAESGFLIIRGAVSAEACDRFSNDITEAWQKGDERLLVHLSGEGSSRPLTAGSPRVQARVVDSYVYFHSALELLLSDSITSFLRIVFEDDPLLFQSLSFDMGSEQGLHQDTAYVVVSSPLELAAAWIALEDVREGSGELTYIPGSHRLPEYHFSGNFKHWNPQRDPKEQHDEWSSSLRPKAETMGLKPEVFRPRKGDALIWAADLAHGGSLVKDRALTRRSLVGHFCPNRIDPNYFSYKPESRVKGRFKHGFYSTAYYQIT